MHAYRDQYAQLFNDGQDVVLLAISGDSVEELSSWARDDQFQFLMASDPGAEVGKAYGALASRPGMTNRNLFVVGPDGKIAFVAAPFREVDPTAYTELAAEVDKLVPEEE
jgi:peroxiredoxin